MRPEDRGRGAATARERVVVWVDSREARIAHRQGEAITVERLPSDVPAHSSASRHVRHDPTMHHGGGGDAESAAERRRLEHLHAFLSTVEAKLDPAADLEVVGPGTVHEQLARRLRAADGRHRRGRSVAVARLGPLTDRQLAARLRAPTES